MTDVRERFARETAEHKMTVLHDDGLYRHVAFRHTGRNYSGYYWFDLITVPGTLVFRGDGESFVFSRSEDMFEFFRGSAHAGGPNLGYWAEKVTSDRDSLKTFSHELFVQTMREHYIELIRERDVPPGTSKAFLEHAEGYDWTYEVNARQMLDHFVHKGFRFHDTWEWDFRDYDWWFAWACHAIVWGICQYDQLKASQPAAGAAARLVTVELPEAA